MNKILALAAALLISALALPARAQSAWDSVARVVVMGDLHGDYAKFEDQLRTAGLVDARGNWAGGRTHLVQLGDVPDRAPDTRRIMDHLMRLERQAPRAGGYVHALIGNHEAMNILGDLRYTVAGEFAAFADRDSARRRDIVYQRTLEYLRAQPQPEGTPPPVYDEAFRAQWEAAHPLGWVEHRVAWSKNGPYGRWVLEHDAVIRIGDTLYLHAGISPGFLSYDLDTLNRAVRDAISAGNEADPVLGDLGPLWYRGFALNEEALEAPQVQATLEHFGVARIVVGHTKVAPTVFPRFNGRVIIADIAAPAGYADPHAYLIQEGGALTTVHRGRRAPLRASTLQETCAYLAAVAALDPSGSPVAHARAECGAQP
jgi:hypothetical protein